MPLAVSFHREAPWWPAALAERMVESMLDAEGHAGLRVHLLLVDDAESRAINAEHLAHDYETDVIAFDLRIDDEEDGSELADPEGEDPQAEVVLNLSLAEREAAARGHAAATEALFYLAHAVLHLCGHDDASEAEREAMHEKQRIALKAIGIEACT